MLDYVMDLFFEIFFFKLWLLFVDGFIVVFLNLVKEVVFNDDIFRV